jgi:hypothetical protein
VKAAFSRTMNWFREARVPTAPHGASLRGPLQ